MASPGRKPKHPHLKIVTGNPGKRPVPDTVPVAPLSELAEPDWRDWFPTAIAGTPRGRASELARARRIARDEWRRIVPELIRHRLLTILDVGSLADYCVCVARIDQAERQLSREGLTVDGAKGIVRNPVATVLNQYRVAAKAHASEFGFGLSSRGRLKLPVSPDDEPGADLLD